MAGSLDHRGPFFDPADTQLFPFVAALQERWLDVRCEMQECLESAYKLWPTNDGYSGEWRLLPLVMMQEEAPGIGDYCPVTMSLLRQIPGLTTAAFSRLHPGTHIEPHRGFTDTVLRYHLALDVPNGTRFRIGSEERVWQEGETWIFDDTFEHEAENLGDRPRTVLLLDFLRPYGLAENRLKLLIQRILFRHRARRSIIWQVREQWKVQWARGDFDEVDKDAINPP